MSKDVKITTERFTRKPFEVDAIQVTAENIEDVAKWCGGIWSIDKTDPRRGERPYIKVKVHNPLNEKQTMAYIGDWVTGDAKGYKVFPDRAFKATFDKIAKPAVQIHTDGPSVKPGPLHYTKPPQLEAE